MTQNVQQPTELSGRWWALAALAFAMLTVGIDMTILNVALPTLAVDLQASSSEMQWFGASFTLVLGALIIPMGGLGDRFGRKRLLLTGLVVFGVASAACAFASSSELLIAARAAQGVGGAAMIPLSLAMLPALFPDADERTRAMNIWVTCSAVGLPLGPIVGGWLLEHFDWGSVFLINVPMVALGVLALARFLPETKGQTSRPIDVIGISLSAVGLTSATYGLIRVGDHGWDDAVALVTMGVGVAVLAVFVVWERLTSYPIIDLSLFASRSFTMGAALATIANFALFGLLFVMPQYLQDVRGSDPLGTGVRLLPMIGGMALATRFGPALVKRLGPWLAIVSGLALSTVALGLASLTEVDTNYAFTATWITLLGAGIGLLLPASMTVAMGALSPERAGSGSGLLQALRQTGGAIGIAILGTILSTIYRDRLADGSVPEGLEAKLRPSIGAAVNVADGLGDVALRRAVRAAFVEGMEVVFVASAAITLVGIMAAVFLLPRRVTR